MKLSLAERQTVEVVRFAPRALIGQSSGASPFNAKYQRQKSRHDRPSLRVLSGQIYTPIQARLIGLWACLESGAGFDVHLSLGAKLTKRQ